MLCQFTVKNYKSIRNEVTFDMQAAAVSEHKDRIIKEINPMEVECFISNGDKVYALINKEEYLVKKRLYELNELLGGMFTYINQSCLANLNLVDHFDASIGGTLFIIFKSGYKDYVSRRQIKNIKERIGKRKWKEY